MFPRFPLLTRLHFTGRMREIRLQPGDRVEPDANYAYLVTRGTAQLLRAGPGGHDILLRVLRPGEILRETGLLQAETRLELLAMPAARFSRSARAGGLCRSAPSWRRPSPSSPPPGPGR